MDDRVALEQVHRRQPGPGPGPPDLDEDHYDLEKVKKRILEYLAGAQAEARHEGPHPLLRGAAGTGKTSLGRSIARALGRKFVRLSLGGRA